MLHALQQEAKLDQMAQVDKVRGGFVVVAGARWAGARGVRWVKRPTSHQVQCAVRTPPATGASHVQAMEAERASSALQRSHIEAKVATLRAARRAGALARRKEGDGMVLG